MWVVDKSKALCVVAITGSQNKIPFMKLQKKKTKMLLHNIHDANGSKLRVLMECRLNNLSEKEIFMLTLKFIVSYHPKWNSSGV